MSVGRGWLNLIAGGPGVVILRARRNPFVQCIYQNTGLVRVDLSFHDGSIHIVVFWAVIPVGRYHILEEYFACLMSVRLSFSARLSVFISAVPTGRMSVKFDTGYFVQNLWIKCRFG
jgi:hypothetical protein